VRFALPVVNMRRFLGKLEIDDNQSDVMLAEIVI